MLEEKISNLVHALLEATDDEVAEALRRVHKGGEWLQLLRTINEDPPSIPAGAFFK